LARVGGSLIFPFIGAGVGGALRQEMSARLQAIDCAGGRKITGVRYSARFCWQVSSNGGRRQKHNNIK
jgi:hypothetical protein